MKEKTYEGTKKTQNGLKRMFFSVLAILLQAVFMVYMFTRLNEYAAAINTTTSVLAIILVLGLYNREQTASMTTPWIILILAFPIMGVSLYLLVGLNGAPNKMRARFEEVDSMLLPCLPENADILSDMYEKVPQAAGISTYLAKNALYPVYQNTDVTYYDQASKGLEAQLSDLSKARKFIFMEYHAIEDKESWHRIQKVLTERVQAGVEVRDSMLLPCLPENADILSDMYEKVPQAAGISTYLAKNALYPVYQNTDVTYYDQASKGLEAQLSDLSKARKFIFMEYHAIEDKESWHRIQKVLTERVQAGVEVRVFYDDMGSIFFIDRDFSEKMEKLGIKCRVFNPVAPAFNMFLNNRDHRKITVIDGKIAYTGGYNLANEYFNVTHPYGIWKDTGIRLEGDAVKSFTIAFLEMWNASERKVPREVDVSQYLLHYDYEAKQSGFIQPYADSPLDNEQVGEDVYISMANKAQRYCWFITPYLIITDEMSHALTLAAKRGVDVRIITPGIPDKKPIYSVTRSFYNQLVKHGVRIFEWTPGFCHAKMSVADDIMATCGTINLDYRSLYHHFENGCFMADCEVVHEIRDDFIRLFTESAEVTEKYRTGRSARRRLGQSIMRLFAGLL